MPFVSPPGPTQLKTRMVVSAPPLVNVRRSRMSPTVWAAEGAVRVQADRALEEPEAHVLGPVHGRPVGAEEEVLMAAVGPVYLAANASVMSSASGTEPCTSVVRDVGHVGMSWSSFEPRGEDVSPSGSCIPIARRNIGAPVRPPRSRGSARRARVTVGLDRGVDLIPVVPGNRAVRDPGHVARDARRSVRGGRGAVDAAGDRRVRLLERARTTPAGALAIAPTVICSASTWIVIGAETV